MSEPATTPYTAQEEGAENVPATTPYTAQVEGAENVSEGEGEYFDEETMARQGHLCFGCLFDMRIGTVMANSMNVVLKIIIIAFDISWGQLYPVITSYCSLLLSLVGIFGALYFETLPVWLCSLGFTAVALVHLIGGAEWFAFFFDTFLVYPTLILALQLQRGMMTKENYTRREEYLDPRLRPVVDFCV